MQEWLERAHVNVFRPNMPPWQQESKTISATNEHCRVQLACNDMLRDLNDPL